jgi:hypothetical protein
MINLESSVFRNAYVGIGSYVNCMQEGNDKLTPEGVGSFRIKGEEYKM